MHCAAASDLEPDGQLADDLRVEQLLLTRRQRSVEQFVGLDGGLERLLIERTRSIGRLAGGTCGHLDGVAEAADAVTFAVTGRGASPTATSASSELPDDAPVGCRSRSRTRPVR
jgi:hypothetical protein